MVLSSDSGTISRTITRLAPSCMAQIAQPAPPRWNIGMQTSEGPPSRSSGISIARHRPVLSTLAPVSIAPFGRPVVPEVENCQETAPSASRRGSSPPRGSSSNVMVRTPDASACDLNSGPTTISFGLTSAMIWRTSSGVSRQLSGAATMPALSSANSSSR